MRVDKGFLAGLYAGSRILEDFCAISDSWIKLDQGCNFYVQGLKFVHGILLRDFEFAVYLTVQGPGPSGAR